MPFILGEEIRKADLALTEVEKAYQEVALIALIAAMQAWLNAKHGGSVSEPTLWGGTADG